MPYHHITAMRDAAVAQLNCRPGKTYVDGTLGGCGHARIICEQIRPGGRFIGVDQDSDAIANARTVLAPYEDQIALELIHGNFSRLTDYLSQLKITTVDGILLDLGISLHHLQNSGRGFSFQREEPLDMRMNVGDEQTAADLVNGSSAADLEKIFREYGEERYAGRIARAVAAARRQAPIRTSRELAAIVSRAIPRRSAVSQAIHPATRVFMALRIAVNRELEVLQQFLATALDLLARQGRLCFLSFHSLEDRIVKQWINREAKGCTCPSDFPQCTCGRQPRLRILTRKPLRPDAGEVARNPMARSTRLRAAEKL
ncbi:MAG: 16S rRNA (cytosine(1402)-N(4))-methyltransferase RsmH [Desulfosarcinaceae bacterium]|nr:16S rRNA (cytosine(1402)-N(4))-methyltransferase RsmH [Desulfosarcinaceae bacterium]